MTPEALTLFGLQTQWRLRGGEARVQSLTIELPARQSGVASGPNGLAQQAVDWLLSVQPACQVKVQESLAERLVIRSTLDPALDLECSAQSLQSAAGRRDLCEKLLRLRALLRSIAA